MTPKLQFKMDRDEDGIMVEMSITADCDLDSAVNAAERFIRACGFSFDGRLAVVDHRPYPQDPDRLKDSATIVVRGDQ